MPDEEQFVIPDRLPVVPLREMVLFPYMIMPLMVGRETSIRAVDKALAKDRFILVVTQKEAGEEQPGAEDIYKVGMVAMIMKMLKTPEGRVKILVQGLLKARIVSLLQERPFALAEIEKIKEEAPGEVTPEMEALMRTVKQQFGRMASSNAMISPEVMVVLESLDDPGKLADIVAANLALKTEEAQGMLEIFDPVSRLNKVNDLLNREMQVLEVQAKIQSQAKEEMDKTQREYLLRQQLKAIQQELGEKDEKSQEISEFREKIKAASMPEKVEAEAEKELHRLELMHPEAAEAAVVRTYLEWLVELPWSKSTTDNLNIGIARQVLDDDHYDLDKVKDRVLEYLSVRKLKEKVKGPILCFVGPPGVGKTSLGKSIARALGRQFWRISLGGVRDEAEIRGHRRTYIGALPGRIIQGIRQTGSNNPVFMMDEIDKIGADFRGDPSAALLEVLDPEQNHAFSDHYLGVPFDLSNVMFMTTANLIDPIPPALLDRMEVIEIPGYTEEEKLRIARKYLIPRQLEGNGVKEEQFSISDAAVLKLISHYTREAGLRNLERELAAVIRKVARGVAEERISSAEVTEENLQEYLGVAKFMPEALLEPPSVGLATGLAWTPYGGELLHVEASVVRGKGEVTVTGYLGEVMKESAQAARTFARSKILADETLTAGLKEKMKKLFRHAELGDIDDFYQVVDIHIHVPAGAIPKDGPSAGITMATALVSALTDLPVRKDIAMTGEITLRGRVLPVGGLKEKSLAALRSGVNNIIIPEKNEKDLEEIPENARRQLSFIVANHMDQVLEAALLKKPEGEKKVVA